LGGAGDCNFMWLQCQKREEEREREVPRFLETGLTAFWGIGSGDCGIDNGVQSMVMKCVSSLKKRYKKLEKMFIS